MLTLGKMSPDQAVSYFTQDNYYQQKDSIELSEWFGEGAEELGMSGPVANMEVFRNLCGGFDPTGTVQLREAPKNGKPVAGIDATFSAPKSLSLAALVGGDDRLIVAHKAAVKVALDIMTERYLKTRLKHEHIKAFKPIVAMFDHDTSRELDPQLHTHTFWLNLCQTKDGNWQSMSNEQFYEFKMLLGQIYRNELARLCQGLGYKIEHRSDGLFELAGYSREQVLQFSERHNQIMQTLEDMGLPDTTENRIFALFKTRRTKEKDIDREALRAYWIRTAEAAGIKHPVPGEAIQEAVDIQNVVDQALRHCEERRSVFQIEAMERFITESPTGHNIEAIHQAIANHPKTIHKDQHLATQWSLEREKLTLAVMQIGKGTQVPIGVFVENEKLSAAQLASVNLVMTSSDRVVGWVGVAGAVKTHTVSGLIEAIDGAVTVMGLTPDASAAQTLQQETGLKSNTVASFLLSKPSPERRLIVVDEAGKLSAREAYELLKKSKAENFQLVLIGDPKQLSAVEAGNPFKALIENGMDSTRLGDFFRQKDPTLNRAVQMIYHDWGVESLQLLNSKGWVNEYPDFAQRMQAIAQQWAASEGDARVMAGTHIEREALTTLLRNHLREQGKLANTEYQAKILKGKDLTQEQAQHVRYYDVGDILIAGQHQHGLRASLQYRVTKKEGSILHLEAGYIKATVDLATLQKPLNVRVYQAQEIGVSVGDQLRWTQNNHKLGRVNGQEFSVMGIEDGLVRIRYDNGKRDQVGLSQLNHIDHGLVRTVYSSQGMTCDRVLIAVGTDQTVTKESILVAMSCAKYEAQFFCADKGLLFERVEQSGSQVNIAEWLKEKGFKLKAPEPPSHIDLKHWVERVEQSGIDARCLPTLKPGDRPAYKGWGELKPDNPRIDVEKTLKKGSPPIHKYEAPLDDTKGIFFPDVSNTLGDKIYERFGINPTPEQRASGFWPCVYWHPQIEIHLMMGKKKAEANTSQGYPCIALPSVTGGYRSKDENGESLSHWVLHDELIPFAITGRTIKMTFNHDNENVRRELVRTGELLQEAGCNVKVVKWKGENSYDDFTMNNGPNEWAKRLGLATPLEWTARQYYANEYRKLSAWVQKQHGQATDQRKIDIALAIICKKDNREAAKLLAHSPALKYASTDKAEAYFKEIFNVSLKVKQQMEPPKHEIRIGSQ